MNQNKTLKGRLYIIMNLSKLFLKIYISRAWIKEEEICDQMEKI